MWVEFKISDRTYYLLASQVDETSMDCLLYDGNECWYEKEDNENLFERAKDCNKRIRYDNDTVKSTLLKGQPTGATLLKNDQTPEEFVLTIKLKVQLYPFTFVWHLKKRTMQEFYIHIMNPVFEIMEAFNEQNIELRSALRKKDTELFHYQICGGLSKGATFASRFDFTKIDEKYAELKANFEILKKIHDHLKKMPVNPYVAEVEMQHENETPFKKEVNAALQEYLNAIEETVPKADIKIELKSEITTPTLKRKSQSNLAEASSPNKSQKKDLKRKIEYLSTDDSSDEKQKKP